MCVGLFREKEAGKANMAQYQPLLTLAEAREGVLCAILTTFLSV